MMDDYWKSPDRCRAEQLEHEKRQAYADVCPPMNRAQRRTARGRMMVAQGEAAALRAEVEFLRQELEELKSEN